jgi:hypothetical protein
MHAMQTMRMRKVIDDHGHAHDERGRFASSSSGGGVGAAGHVRDAQDEPEQPKPLGFVRASGNVAGRAARIAVEALWTAEHIKGLASARGFAAVVPHIAALHERVGRLHAEVSALPDDLRELKDESRLKLEQARRALAKIKEWLTQQRQATATAGLQKAAYQIAIRSGCDLTVALRKAREESPDLYYQAAQLA